jgi:hypothetical protein
LRNSKVSATWEQIFTKVLPIKVSWDTLLGAFSSFFRRTSVTREIAVALGIRKYVTLVYRVTMTNPFSHDGTAKTCTPLTYPAGRMPLIWIERASPATTSSRSSRSTRTREWGARAINLHSSRSGCVGSDVYVLVTHGICTPWLSRHRISLMSGRRWILCRDELGMLVQVRTRLMQWGSVCDAHDICKSMSARKPRKLVSCFTCHCMVWCQRMAVWTRCGRQRCFGDIF